MNKSKKSQARDLALQALYEQEFNKPSINNKNKYHLPNPAHAEKAIKNYAHDLLNGITTHQKKIDQLIKQTSMYWKMERMSLIDLNIMRIAIYEMLYSTPPVPFKVCINEALEMAKIYSAEDSSKFINGNLDAIFKKTKKD